MLFPLTAGDLGPAGEHDCACQTIPTANPNRLTVAGDPERSRSEDRPTSSGVQPPASDGFAGFDEGYGNAPFRKIVNKFACPVERIDDP